MNSKELASKILPYVQALSEGKRVTMYADDRHLHTVTIFDIHHAISNNREHDLKIHEAPVDCFLVKFFKTDDQVACGYFVTEAEAKEQVDSMFRFYPDSYTKATIYRMVQDPDFKPIELSRS